MSSATESQPLLPHHHALSNQNTTSTTNSNPMSTTERIRHQVRRFLTSKTGHYAVLLLVSLDVLCIFADFLLSLYVCEHTCKAEDIPSGEKPHNSSSYAMLAVVTGVKETLSRVNTAQTVLGIVSITFSSLFLLELIASIAAFGPKFFKSKFHCFDALVILASFIVDVCLKGVLEEIGSIVIVLRLWRVVKIIEELSAGAEEQMEQLREQMEKVIKERDEVITKLEDSGVKWRGGSR